MRIGVDTFGLLHVMFVSMANVIDCEGVVAMIGYAVSYLSGCQAVLVDVCYAGESFVNSVKGLMGAVLRLLSVVSCISLWFFLSVGLLSVRLVGLKIIVCCGKIVNENSPALYKPQN